MIMRLFERKHSMVTLAILVVAILAISWFGYFGLRDGMAGWAIGGAVAIIVFFAVLACNAYRPLPEQRLEADLLAASNTQRVGALVLGVQRQGTRESEERRQTLLGLTLALDSGGTTRLDVAIEDALLPAFASGQRIQVLQDPQHPERVALDRAHTPTQVR